MGISPYNRFNFRVNLASGGTAPNQFNAGFQEVAGLGIETTVAEYRAGLSNNLSVRKIPGAFKFGNVTLKRGVIGDSASLYDWLNAVRNGGPGRTRTVVIQLMNAQQNPVQQWKLINARPTRFTGATPTPKTTEVAVEALVLFAERIELG